MALKIRGFSAIIGTAAAFFSAYAVAAPAAHPVDDFNKEIRPLLEKYCYDCHGEGEKKGNIAFDELKTQQDLLQNRELWWKVLKNVRSGIMPPQNKPHPEGADKQLLASWIKYDAFGIDAENPDPGRVTIRRLNRVEYRNTIRDLMGVDYNTTEEFPPDDTGYGFDTIGDVLSVSPLLLEKYMKAAEVIVNQSVPTVGKSIAETTFGGRIVRAIPQPLTERLSFYKETIVPAKTYIASHDGSYKVAIDLEVRGDFNFDPGRAKLVLKVDDQEQWSQDFGWQNGKKYHLEVPLQWKQGDQKLVFELHPLTPEDQRRTNVDLQIQMVKVQGPLEKQYWVVASNYRKFFPQDEPPQGASERREYARQVLTAFAKKAFRRPPEPKVIDRLVAISEAVYTAPGKNFEQGIREAMIAILSSPRFLFRVEKAEPGKTDDQFARVDEYALACRLSYFLWSTMPDQELMDLADKGQLRANFEAQVKRLMADQRSESMIRNFAGQWLQLRDLEGIAIDARTVLGRDQGTDKDMQEAARQRQLAFQQLQQNRGNFQQAGANGNFQQARANGNFQQVGANGNPATRPATQPTSQPATQPAFARGNGRFGNNPQRQQFRNRFRPAVELDGPLRLAMRNEAEMVFESIVRDNRDLADLLDCNYTYVNDKLAKLYGIPNVAGTEMRKVELPPDSPRGGILTMGSLLVVTSNPTRTSPVKRGQFILDNLLGMPTPPPPPDIPPLEASDTGNKDHEPTFREVLEIHRSKPLCKSCHARMDPLGLSLENFNALGMYREKERGNSIDASGKLLTGESFKNASELKEILRKNHVQDFYRCLTEKMLTYALGRGLEYYDVETVDRIVDRIEKDHGKFSALLMGIVESAPFQERRKSTQLPPREQDQRVQVEVKP
jgi:hypothetical protein